MSFYLAKSLDKLRDEINELFPNRDKTSDGWIGDTSHSARKSDHNPDWSAGGIVRALDVDVDDGAPGRDLRKMLIKAVSKDARAWYVISNGVIYSRTFGWQPRRYTGSNPHFTHVHISLRHGFKENSRSAWLDGSRPPAPPALERQVDLSNVRDQFLAAIGEADDVRVRPLKGIKHIQRALNKRYGTGLDVDGVVGRATLDAWGVHEARHPVRGSGRPRVPDETSLAGLSWGEFRVVR